MMKSAKAGTIIPPDGFIFKDMKIHTALGEEWDISDLVVEVKISESIVNFAVEYEFSIVDSADMFNFLKINGDEKITFSLSKMTEEGRVDIDKECYIMDIPIYSRQSETTQVYKLRGISLHGYLAAIKKISRKISGSPTNIIKRLIESDLKTNIVHYDGESAGSIRGIIPYMTVKNLIGWLMKRAHDENGLPFFVYEALYDGIHLESYNTMRTHIKDEVYIQGSMSTKQIPIRAEGIPKDKTTEYGAAFIDQKYRINSIDSMLGLSKLRNSVNGAYASYMLEVDIHDKTYNGYNYMFNGKDTIEQFSLYNENFKIDDLPLTSYKTKRGIINKNSNMFDTTANSYNDRISPVAGKMNALMENLNTLSHIIEVPGDITLHAGTTINLQVPRPVKADIEHKGEAGFDSKIDPYMSGKYMVISITHKFDADGHYMTLKLKRDSIPIDLKETRR